MLEQCLKQNEFVLSTSSSTQQFAAPDFMQNVRTNFLVLKENPYLYSSSKQCLNTVRLSEKFAVVAFVKQNNLQ